VHFGIAIASTLTHFWTLAALLVVVGLGWLDRPETAEAVPAADPVEPMLTAKVQPAAERAPRGSAGAPAGRSGSSASARKGGPAGSARSKQPAKAGSDRRRDAVPPRHALATPRPAGHLPAAQPFRETPPLSGSPILTLLPYVGVAALITLVLTWDYLVNQTAAQSAFDIFWKAFTVRVDGNAFRIVQSPMLLVMLIFTWTIGALLALADIYSVLSRTRGRAAAGGPSFWANGVVVYFGAVIGVFFIYGLIHASRVNYAGLAGMAVFQRIAGHIIVFDVALLLLILLTAGGLWFAESRYFGAESRPRPTRWFGETGALAVGGGAVALALALLVIVNVNIRTVQADTYYKQGLAYESAGAWESAVILYHQSARLQPDEDFYYLFMGRGLLQFAGGAAVANPVLPADLTKTATGDLLGFVERGLRARDREDLMRASHAALVAAQRLNPLNTDHSANLARLHRSWAFANALGPNDAPSNDALRRIVATRPQDVDLLKLDRSLAYYQQATSLSPQNAQLWNELASVQFVKGDIETALKTLDHSLTLDQQYFQTYVLRGDVLGTLGDRQGSLDAYRQATKYARDDVGVLSAVGVYSAQSGDLEGALTAFRRIIELQTAALNSAQSQLVSVEALASRAGGYGNLLRGAAERRDGLNGAIASQKSQLHLSYRNMALILRDMSRPAEALEAAAKAQSLANDAERPTIDALITDLQKRLTP
jgi:tetratricopeptide (TPR) repeat protein